MIEWGFTIVIFVGVIAVTAFIFGVWLIVSIMRLVFRGIGRVGRAFSPHGLPPMPAATRGIVCPHERCKAVNPAGAKFCRRCGRELPVAHRVSVRRAALW